MRAEVPNHCVAENSAAGAAFEYLVHLGSCDGAPIDSRAEGGDVVPQNQARPPPKRRSQARWITSAANLVGASTMRVRPSADAMKLAWGQGPPPSNKDGPPDPGRQRASSNTATCASQP